MAEPFGERTVLRGRQFRRNARRGTNGEEKRGGISHRVAARAGDIGVIDRLEGNILPPGFGEEAAGVIGIGERERSGCAGFGRRNPAG